jgi:1,4-dihydroxy-2-naphthoate octaprenyltransferase
MAIDFKMWGEALRTMPKVERSEWAGLDVVSKWLIATRASVLFMTVMAAAVAGILAVREGVFQWWPWLLAVAGLAFAHATNNLLNDYTDSVRGVDKDNYYRNQYGVHVLEDGLMSPAQFWRYLGFTGLAAIVCGLCLVSMRSGATLELMLAGAFFVLFYTWPLKYYGLGEPAVLLVWGPLMVGGVYYVVSGVWSWDVTWLSLVYALGPTTVLFGKHTDKIEFDQAKGVNTLPVILGERWSRWSVIGMLLAQYILSLVLVIKGAYYWPLLLVFASLPNLIKVINIYRAPKPQSPPQDYPGDAWPLWFSAHSFVHTRKFTSLFLLGLILDVILY